MNGIGGQERINYPFIKDDQDYQDVGNNPIDYNNVAESNDPTDEEGWWSKWGKANPEGRFNAISGLANYIESTQRARELNKARSRGDLASAYTGVKYRDQVQTPSVTNMIYAYNLAERNRAEKKQRSKRWENMDKILASKVAALG